MTVTALETRPKRKRSSHPATANGIPTPTPGRTSTSCVIATGPLADILEPHIDLLSATYGNTNTRVQTDELGGVEVLAHRTAASLHHTSSEAVIRRLYDIRHGKSRTVGTELADALLMALDLDINLEKSIATLPGGTDAALEMATIHYEDSGEEFTELDVRRLADGLLGFARGYVADATDETIEDYEEWGRRVASHKLKRARHHGYHPFQQRYEWGQEDAA